MAAVVVDRRSDLARDVRVAVLGPLEVWHGARALEVRGPTRRALLARLVVQPGRPVSTSALVDDMWEEQAGRSVATLQSHVSHLRRDLGPAGALLETTSGGYRLAVPATSVDAAAFEQAVRSAEQTDDPIRSSTILSAALSAWRDEPMAEFARWSWARAAAVRLHELRWRAIETHARAELALGRHPPVVAEIESLLAREPLREGSWLLLMEALRAGGRHAEAVRAARRCREALGEVGLTPSPNLVEAEARILRHEAVGVPDPHRSGRAVSRGRVVPDLVGRSEVLAAIDQAIDETIDQAGCGRVVVVEGEPGIGKSAVAQEAARRVGDRGGRVLLTRCDEAVDAPLQPFVEALSQYVDTEIVGPVGSRLGRWPEVLASLVPEQGLADGAVPPSPDGADVGVLLRAVTDWITCIAAERPTLLVVEDLHWASTATLRQLRHLARSPPPGSLVLATLRDSERPPPVAAALIADVVAHVDTTVLPLGPLGQAAVAAIARDAGPDPGWDDERWGSVVAALHRLTGGNPLYLQLVLPHLGEQGGLGTVTDENLLAPPRSVQAMVRQRTGRLSSGALDVLERAAVLGTEFDARVLWHMVEMSPEGVAEGIEESIGAGFVEPVEEPGPAGGSLHHRFRHALVRLAIYRGISGARRVVLHRSAGRALDDLPGDDRGRSLALIAHHHSIAADLDPLRAVRALHAAGRQALVRGGASAAEDVLRRAVSLADRCPEVEDDERCELLLDLGEAQRTLDPERARGTFLHAAGLADRVADAGRLARAAKGIGRGFASVPFDSPDPERVALIERAVLAQPPSSSDRARLLISLAGELQLAGDRDRARQVVDGAVTVAAAAGDADVRALALATKWDLLFHPSTLAEREEVAAELGRTAARTTSPAARWRAAMVGLCCRTERGRGSAADAADPTFERLHEQVQGTPMAWLATATRGTVALACGDLAVAEQRALEVLADRADGGHLLGAGYAGLFQVRWVQGRLGELDGMWDPALEAVPAGRAAHALVCLHAGRPDQAVEVIDDLVGGSGDVMPVDSMWGFGVVALAEVLAGTGRRGPADELRGVLIPQASQWLAHSLYFLGPVSHVLGSLSVACGDLGAADRWYAEAEAQLVRFGAPALLAHVRTLRRGVPARSREEGSGPSSRRARSLLPG